MTPVLDKFRSLLPKIKSSPSGWISFNAPCCHNRGHSRDTRKRAGVMFTDGVVYNCFNCKFSTGWKPGASLSPKFRSLCQWLGASDDIIKDMIFEALKTESSEYQTQQYLERPKFNKKDLPQESLPLSEWVDRSNELSDALQSSLVSVIEYVSARGFDPMSNNFFWSTAPGYEDRVLIPFLYDGEIVGNTARKVSDGRPKYLSDQPPYFVFNVDAQIDAHQQVFVAEGPFDALSIGGVALLTNEISEQQAQIITSIGKTIIVVPDQDRAGMVLVDQIKDKGWKIAFPNWEYNVKDCADAVQKYGKLFVTVDLIKTATDNPAKIEIEKRRILNELEKHSD